MSRREVWPTEAPKAFWDNQEAFTEKDGGPAGADPIWQPHAYLQGCAGWCATTGYLEAPNSETPWLMPLYPGPWSEGHTLNAWLWFDPVGVDPFTG